MLREIHKEDLIFSEEPENDRINTFLTLDDYDWMSYSLKTKFRTKEDGIIKVDFNYFGATRSLMEVEQSVNGKQYAYRYSYPTEMFAEFICNFLKEHMKQWDSTYAFYGGDMVLDFYNTILSVGKQENRNKTD